MGCEESVEVRHVEHVVIHEVHHIPQTTLYLCEEDRIRAEQDEAFRLECELRYAEEERIRAEDEARIVYEEEMRQIEEDRIREE